MMESVVASYSGETDSGLQWVEESRPSIINFHPHMLTTKKNKHRGQMCTHTEACVARCIHSLLYFNCSTSQNRSLMLNILASIRQPSSVTQLVSCHWGRLPYGGWNVWH